MIKAMRIHAPGGPEALRWEEVALGDPGQGEVRLRHTAIGVNFIDIYHRTGLYPLEYPAIPGVEGVGVVERSGPGAAQFSPGDRVAYATAPSGAYATHRNIPEKLLVKLPDTIDDRTAAAVMLKGLTAHYLIQRTFIPRAGNTLLIHAAAGGVGLLLCQWAKHLGAVVIGTVGSAEKAAIAKEHGCDHVINYREEDFVARVKDITSGGKVNVVYDSVGKDTFMGSLDCLMHFGLMVSYGQSSGPVPPLDIALLAKKGSLFLTRPTLFHYKKDHAELLISASQLFELVGKKILNVRLGRTYPLAEAAKAQREIESRQTVGSTILTVA